MHLCGNGALLFPSIQYLYIQKCFARGMNFGKHLKKVSELSHKYAFDSLILINLKIENSEYEFPKFRNVDPIANQI